MIITILKHKIDLCNKVVLVTPDKEINFKTLGLKPSELMGSNIALISSDLTNRHLSLERQLFLNNLDRYKDTKHILVKTTNPLSVLWLPEDSCVYKIGVNSVKKFDSSYYRNLTPNSLLTSEIFDFKDLVPESHLENEHLRTEETYQEVKISDETRHFLKEVAQKMKNQQLNSSL